MKIVEASSSGWPVVVLTTFFPSSVEPYRTVFVKNLVAAMRPCRNTTVVAPVPVRPWPWRQPVPPREETIEGIPVIHPRFLALPGLDVLTPLTYALGVHGELRRLRATRGRFVLHAHCAYPDGVAAALLARWLNVPCVVTAHGSDINVYAGRATLRRQLSWALSGAGGLVAVSRALTEQVRLLVRKTDVEIQCIPCAGFDPAMFGPRERQPQRDSLGIARHARVVVYVGQLVALKQVDCLISAWVALRDAGRLHEDDRLVIVGAGPKEAVLRAQVGAAGIAALVRFTGVLPQQEVSGWISAADVLSLPSRSEGMPNVIVEALACGVPVVASNVGGIPELIAEGRNGFLVPSGNTSALAEALIRALEHPFDRLAVRRSVEEFTWDRLARRNLELIDRITAERTHAAVA
ncbi:MAG: glycosyltransferase, partial [Vicinamibacterales bacterium]